MKTDNKKTFPILAIAFVLLNAIYFTVAYIVSADIIPIVISWVFLLLGFALILVCMKLNNEITGLNHAMFLGLTIFKHCMIYLVIDILLSILFLLLAAYTPLHWAISLLVQLIVFTVYAVLISFCVTAKKRIETVITRTETKTTTMKLLKADAFTLLEYCKDIEARSAISEFAEAVKYSDPVSCDAISDLEEQLSDLVTKMKQALVTNEVEAAKAYCAKAMIVLNERNVKCKILKPKY